MPEPLRIFRCPECRKQLSTSGSMHLHDRQWVMAEEVEVIPLTWVEAALAEQASEYQREGRAQTGLESQRLFTAANVVDSVTRIVFGDHIAIAAAEEGKADV